MSNKIGQAHNQQLQYFRQHKYKMKLPCLLSEIYEIENAPQNIAAQQPPLVQQSHLLVQHQTSINTPPTPPPSINQHMTPSPHSHHHQAHYHPHTHLNQPQQYHLHNQPHNNHHIIVAAAASNTPPSRNPPQQTQLIQVAAPNGQQYAPQAAFIKADDSFNVTFIKQQSQYQPQQQPPQNKNMSGFIRFASSIN